MFLRKSSYKKECTRCFNSWWPLHKRPVNTLIYNNNNNNNNNNNDDNNNNNNNNNNIDLYCVYTKTQPTDKLLSLQ